MTRQELIECFRDTQRIAREEYAAETRAMIAGTRLYGPSFQADARPAKSRSVPVQVVEDTTFHCAGAHADGRTTVLNFANAYRPGGGVTTGAMAQEECLCRSSNLYEGLATPELLKYYYRWNKKNTTFIGSNAVIYSPGVVVFKSDDALPVPLDAPFAVDVLTCAAPELYRADALPEEAALAKIYDRRHRSILEVAAANDVDTLVLGAFGCGAFENNPDQVAASFRRLLVDEGWRDCFRQVIFAIKRAPQKDRNLPAFRRAFE